MIVNNSRELIALLLVVNRLLSDSSFELNWLKQVGTIKFLEQMDKVGTAVKQSLVIQIQASGDRNPSVIQDEKRPLPSRQSNQKMCMRHLVLYRDEHATE